MRRVEREPAFLLHARPYRETSLLIEALCARHGRVGLVARGVRADKPRWPRGLLEPFQVLSLGFQGAGELAQLTSVDADAVLPRLVGQRLVCGLYINELTLRLLARDDPHPILFDAYRDCLLALHGDASAAWTLRRFERDLLRALGYAPSFARDVEGMAIDPGGLYRIDPERGAIALRGTSSERGLFQGSHLLAIERDAEPDAATLRALRRITRVLLRPHLGDRAMRATQLLWRSDAALKVPQEAGAFEQDGFEAGLARVVPLSGDRNPGDGVP